ncbi:MAG TPA: hypothetical protein VFK89_10505 [Actinomycetota bacterium]|nr:hypothetical protein [Actinomycetota bacterium]
MADQAEKLRVAQLEKNKQRRRWRFERRSRRRVTTVVEPSKLPIVREAM